MPNLISQLLFKIITGAIGFVYLLSGFNSGFKGEEVNAPENFEPVLRFVVCSDIHLNGDKQQAEAKRFEQLFKDMYTYAEKEKYSALDAVVVVGDFTGGGLENEYEIFNKIVEENKKPETQLLTVLGNHEFMEYRDTDPTVGYDIYKKYINENVDTDIVINGYHFIGVSYDDNAYTFSGKTEWLKERLDNATNEDPTKPVFVYQHPHPTLTVYGSINWSDFDIRKVLSDYPQVVDFSGHSHYAPSDPRSIWQGEFTAIGCGALKAFMGNLNYVEGDNDAPGSSAGAWLVECDKNGNIKLRLYDIESKMFFSDINYYLTDLSDTSKRAYTWHKQKSFDTKPLFTDGAIIDSFKNENGEAIITFPEANGYYPAENYKITVKNENGKKVFEKTAISEYVRATNSDVTVNLGALKKGTYSVKITAYSPYAKKGDTLKADISVN